MIYNTKKLVKLPVAFYIVVWIRWYKVVNQNQIVHWKVLIKAIGVLYKVIVKTNQYTIQNSR